MHKLIRIIFCFNLITIFSGYSKLYSQSIPSLQKKGAIEQLIVDGKPFLVLGGALGNSTASSLDYMHPLWAKFKITAEE